MEGYNWVDYLLLAIFFLTAMSGIVRGGAREIISILSWVAAYIIAGMFSSPVANYFSQTAQVQQAFSSAGSSTVSSFTIIATFCVLFFGTLVIGSIIGSIAGRALDSVGLGIVNRLTGGVAGLFKGYLINVVLIFLVQSTSILPQAPWAQSATVNSMQPAVQWFSNLIAPGLATLKSKMQNFNTNMQDSVTGAFQR